MDTKTANLSLGRSVFFLLLGLFLFYWGGTSIADSWGSENWTPAPGRVTYSGWQEYCSRGCYNTPLVRYTYKVNGVEYRSERVSFSDWMSGSFAGWLSTDPTETYPVNKYVRVYVKPGDPAFSVLEPGVSWDGIYMVGIGFVLMGSIALGKSAWIDDTD